MLVARTATDAGSEETYRFAADHKLMLTGVPAMTVVGRLLDAFAAGVAPQTAYTVMLELVIVQPSVTDAARV